MFNFFNMADNYEQRKVDNTVIADLEIDTALVTDGNKPYETAVKSPLYNNGRWVIVEAYDTEEQAQRGHNTWIEIMANNPPAYLTDCCNSGISQLFKASGGDIKYPASD